MEHWPSGIRDTTQFPSLDINISSELREHLQKFTEMDGMNWEDNAGQIETVDWRISESRIRSYRKMYEKMGLIYKDREEKLRLSTLGNDIKNMESDLLEEKDLIFSGLRKNAISILSRYQLRNPADNYRLPSDCDVFPNICIWKAMIELDGKIHFEEMNRVILRIMKMADLESSIQKIKVAREYEREYRSCEERELLELLGEKVHIDQPVARISAWYSFAGWGGLIINQHADTEGFRKLVPDSVSQISEIIHNPPVYYEAANEDDWFTYYIGEAALTEESEEVLINEMVKDFHNDLASAGLYYDVTFVAKFIASCLAKPFVIFTGLSGSGKTKLSQAFARWMAPVEDNTSSFELISVGADWTSRDSILGYPDALDSSRYVRTQALNIILEAENNQSHPYFMILDEMNLSHVERYFADILSALESFEQLYLHSDIVMRENVPPYLDKLPTNLFIIGTVNIDETTYMFSSKVLDRANVIEFTIDREDISLFLDQPEPIKLNKIDGKGRKYASVFIAATNQNVVQNQTNQVILKEEILLFFDVLSDLGAEFGFRTVKEISRFLYYHNLITSDTIALEDSIDVQILQKILPKLHGSKRKLEPLLCSLASICYDEHVWDEVDGTMVLRNSDELRRKAYESATLDNYNEHPLAINDAGELIKIPENAYYKLSYKKILKMLKQLDQNGFTSFAEA